MSDSTIWIMIGLIAVCLIADVMMFLSDKRKFPIFAILTIVLIVVTSAMIQ